MQRIKVRKRIHRTLTPAERRRVKKTRECITEELPDLVRRNQMRHNARKEKTFSGALRRSIHEFPLSPMKIAEKAEIVWRDFSGFLTGEQTLPSDAIDRLVKVLKLKLPPIKQKPRTRKSRAS